MSKNFKNIIVTSYSDKMRDNILPIDNLSVSPDLKFSYLNTLGLRRSENLKVQDSTTK